MGTEINHPVFAKLYQRIAAEAERRGATEHRQRLLAGLRGRVIEVGAGHGLNFPHYPETVTEVVAVEPEPHLRQRAMEAADLASVSVDVVDGVADDLPGEDGEFDAGVASLVLCTVPDQPRALAELRRAVRSGGELRFYEHVISAKPLMARLMRLADATFWPRIAGGCHCARDTLAGIEATGFTVESCDRFGFKPDTLTPTTPHILGVARRP
jgi:ubiquinone/menaquinone biosynthesis C-methylase UbiE